MPIDPPVIVSSTIWTDQGASLMARIRTLAAVNVTQVSLSAISYTIYDKTGVAVPNVTGTLTIATVIFDTLQTDARWTADATGYNFRWDAPKSIFPLDNRVYRVVVLLTPASGGEYFHAVWEITTKPPQG